MVHFYDDMTKTLRYMGQSKQELLAIPDIESVRTLVIDEKIETIPGNLFFDKSFYNVETIEFAEYGALKIIETEAFKKLLKLKAVRIPNSLKTIGSYAFARCHSLTSIEFPENGALEEIQTYAFLKVEIESIHIPKSVKKIGRGAFWINTLKRIDFAPDCQLETIHETTFKKCKLESILIPACVKEIKEDAFAFNKSLKTIKFTDDSKLEVIHEQAFYETGLESIKIPMLVTQIRPRAFSNCTSLASITFAENSKLVYLPKEAFEGSMKPISPPCPFFDKKGFEYEGKSYDLTKNPFEFDKQALNIFRSFPVFGEIQHATFNQSLQKIPDNSFEGVCSLLSIEIPSSVKIIGKNAFRECKSLVTVRFASDHDCKLEEIDEFAFFSCTNLVSIDFPSSLKHIGSSAFEFCSSLVTVRYADADDSKLVDIEHKAFRSCKDLWNMQIPKDAAIRVDNSMKCCPLKEVQYQSRYDDLPVHKLLYFSTIPGNGDDIGQILKELKMLGEKDREGFERVDDESGMTPLHIYASFPPGSISVEVLKLLLKMGPDTWLVRQDSRGRLPIHYACMVGESDLNILQLLSSDLDVFKRDKDECMPLMLGLRFRKLNSDAETLLYKSQPIPPLMGSEVEENDRLKELKKEYIDWITKAESIKKYSFSPHQQHGWVTFLMKCFDDNDHSDVRKMEEFLQGRIHRDTLTLLATAKDKFGREAMKFAPPRIKIAIQKHLFFLGRYELAEGEPIYKSATCVVIRAKDAKMEDNYRKIFKKHEKDSFLDFETFGEALQSLMIIYDELDEQDKPLLKQHFKLTDTTKREKISENEFIGFCMKEGGCDVALKLMKNKDEYKRELSIREQFGEKIANCVVPVLTSHDSEGEVGEVNIKDSLNRHIKNLPKDESPEDYCHVLVMPFGDRDLDTIFRSEMRRNPLKLRDYTWQIAQLLKKLHAHGLVHGDLKMHNVVRIKRRLMLIDLDASAMANNRIGNKFSSGVVPPEMIYCLTDAHEEDTVSKYYKDADDEHRKKRAPKNVGDEKNKKGYLVRSFSVKRDDENNESGLPYEICIAKKSMDVWAFGVMLYNMCTTKTLFPVNLDDDIVEGVDLKELHEWGTFCRRVNDYNAKTLLEDILQRTPEDRPTMEEILDHDFFRMPKDAEVKEGIQKILDMQMSTNRMVKRLLDGRIYPRYLIPLPTFKADYSKPETWFQNKVKVYFLCPISMEIPVGADGELLGYELKEPKNWVRKYGPALLLAWKIARVAAKAVPGGVNLPSLELCEEMLIKKDTSGFLDNMQKAVLCELEANKGTPTGSAFLAKECMDHFAKLASSEQSIPASYTEYALKAYDGIIKELEDPQFKKSGLVLATCLKDGSTEFVHPDIISVYEEHGKKCFKMDPVEIKQERKAAIERRSVRWKDDNAIRKDREEKAAYYRRSSDNVAHQGPMQKLGQNFPARWCERHFVIFTEGEVRYYDEKNDVDDLTKCGTLLKVIQWKRADSADKKKAHIVLEYTDKEKVHTMNLRLPAGDDTNVITKWIEEGNNCIEVVP